MRASRWHGGALVAAVAGAGVLAAGMLAGAAPAAAEPAVLYAYAVGTAASPASCPQDTASPPVPSAECSLGDALTLAAPGDTIYLATPAASGQYVGNWTVSTPGTTASAPVTIQQAPGLASEPEFDTDYGTSSYCSTASCDGALLTVPSGEYVELSKIIFADGGTEDAAVGGLDNSGTVTITGSTFTGNAGFSIGALENTGTATITGSTFTGNGPVKDPGGAGALDNSGTLTITGSTFTGNTSSEFGAGALENSGTVTITGSTFTGNGSTAASDGGGLDNIGGSVAVTASTFSGNSAENGGAIDSGDGAGIGGSVTVTASTFSGNSAENGGAIDSGYDSGGGSVTVTASTFTGNNANDGGAIDSGDIGGGSVTVTASTFSGNTATGGPGYGGDGGAIDSGDDAGAGTVTVTASTFSGNTATGGPGTPGNGGVIDSGGGGSGGGTVQVAGDVFNGACEHASGTWTDEGYNAGSDGSCFDGGTGDVNAGSGSLDLSSLADNGGPTQTVMPQAGSPVIGMIPDPTTALCPTIDQRGYASAAGTACDAGAVQTAGSPPALTGTPDPTHETLGSAPADLQDSAVLSGGLDPTGTITFTLYDPANTAIYSDVVPVSGDGTYNTATGNNPGGYSTLHAGTYQWDVAYSGDAANGPLADTGDPAEQVVLDPTPQAITFTSTPPPTPVVNGTYPVSATGGGSGNPVTFSIASSSAAVCSVSGSMVTFTSPGECVIDAAQAGNDQYAAASNSQDVPVGPAATTTSVSVQPESITATVTGQPAGAVMPGGTVAFSVDGNQVGTAQLSGGTAVLDYTVPAGATRHVAAAYDGDTNFTGSSASTARRDPSITATLSSKHAKTKYGWYRSPVTVTFACTTHGAPLTAPCPQPVTLRRNGAGQSVTRTITATNGGADTVTVSPVNIDQTKPVITVQGAVSGRAYDAPGPAKITCTATDAVSGLAGRCTATITRTPARVSWRASATSQAGIKNTVTGHATLIDYYVAGVPYRHGHFVVIAGHTYRVSAYVSTRTAPRYVDAAPAGVRPHPDGAALTRIGSHLWAVRVKITAQMTTRYQYWQAGVLVGKTLHLIPLQVFKK